MARTDILPNQFKKRSLIDKVVIIDDDSTSRNILKNIVSTIGENIKCKTFTHPLEALEQIGEYDPDLILVDYRMPELNGIEFVKKIRTIPSCYDIPMMIVTVIEDKDILYEALEAGATDFLTKPVDQHECQARCQNLLTLRRQQKIIENRALTLEDQINSAIEEIKQRERETLNRLAVAGEFKDNNTGEHQFRIGKLSRLIAEQLNQEEDFCEMIEAVAPLHDIGKIGIPDNILLKPGPLDDDELVIMKTHTQIGYEILKDSPSKYLQLGAIIALNHHEKYDGTGYPNSLTGEEIPLAARIVTVADVYDALRDKRPYKDSWQDEEVEKYITDSKGKQFCPDCVDALFRVIDKEKKSDLNLANS